MKYLKGVEIDNLWGSSKNVRWEELHPNVNILVGINGSGKTTLLNLLASCLTEDFRQLKKYNISNIRITISDGQEEIPLRFFKKSNPRISMGTIDFKTEFISTFDIVPPSGRSQRGTPLTAELLDVIYTTGRGKNTFFDYRLKTSNFPEKATFINKRIQSLYELINKQFKATSKTIEIDVHTNKLIFKQGRDVIQLEDLSAGEKQFLLIIFKVFLMEEQSYVLLMDEPEISLDIDWQFDLINIIRNLNPNCQIIISTHSPSIFGDGWGDRVIYMEDILQL